MGNLFLSDELGVFLLVGAIVLLFSKAVESDCSVMSSSGSSFGHGFSRCVTSTALAPVENALPHVAMLGL